MTLREDCSLGAEGSEMNKGPTAEYGPTLLLDDEARLKIQPAGERERC
jgi:hypothetical protein